MHAHRLNANLLDARHSIVGARLPAKTSAHPTSSSPDTAFASKPAPTNVVQARAIEREAAGCTPSHCRSALAREDVGPPDIVIA
jgi:hypothetical protein